MPFACLTCRSVVGHGPGPPPGVCPQCGGELAGEESAYLQWAGPDGQEVLLLSGGEITIGRRSHCNVVLKDVEVSKYHAKLQREGSDWAIHDWRSANGTFVNNQRVLVRRLQDGDIVTVGKTDLHFRNEGLPQGTRSITIVPQTGADDGVQVCLSCEPGDFQPASAISDEKEMRTDYERLRTAYLFNRYMGRERDKRSLLQNILRFAFELLPADRGAILLREEEGAPLACMATLHRGSDVEDIIIPDTILRRAVCERAAVLSGDARADLRFAGSESIISEGVRSAMCVPMAGQSEVLGVIHLDTRETTSAFSVKDLQLLSMVADQAAAVIELYRLEHRLQKEAATRERLSRFLSPEVLEEVVERGVDLEREGRTGRVTVLFCDIRGFSAVAETMDPTQLVRMLNAFFERLVEVVFRHGGVLDKFIGDALMAVWGAPLRRRDDAARALQAGAEILAAVGQFNQGCSSQGWPELQVGIGVNTGEVVMGMVGSQRRMEYTVMGDTVNLASRICDLAQGGQLLLTEETRQELDKQSFEEHDPRFRTQPPILVRGRRAPVRIYQWAGIWTED